MKINFDTNTQTVMFICSPNLAIIDNWVSVLILLRDKLPKAKFIFVIPKKNLVSEIELGSVLFEFLKDIFDLIIFRSDSNVWMNASTFEQIKVLNRKSHLRYFSYLIKYLNNLKLQAFSSIISILYKKLISIIFKKNIFNINLISKTKFITLFDLQEFKQSYMSELNEIIASQFNFSIAHEISIRGINRDSKKKSFQTNKTIIFSFSDKEVAYYQDIYACNRDQIKVYGVPRHDKNWIKSLLEKENFYENEKKYIFLISKPIRPVLTKDKKKIYLQYVKTIAKKFNLNIIVKLHPKEKYDKLFENVFGFNEYNKTWKISIKHPFNLGKHCEFGISLGSGVPIDLLVLGVPTIQIQDLKGIEQYDNEFSLRDKNGYPVNNLAFMKLVLEAKSLDDIEKHVNDILSNKDEVVKKLQVEYNNVYKTFENVNEIIVKNILDKI